MLRSANKHLIVMYTDLDLNFGRPLISKEAPQQVSTICQHWSEAKRDGSHS